MYILIITKTPDAVLLERTCLV